MGQEKISTKEVLQVIGVGGIVLSSLIIPSLPIAIGAVYKKWRNANRSYLGRILKRIEKQELIRISEKGNNTVVEITDKGKHKLLKYNFDDLKIKNKRHDGKFRLIIFDIPDYFKTNRNKFREKLIRLGCIRLQESVFVSAYNCRDEVDFLCHYLDISEFVIMIKIDKMERGEKLIYKNLY